MTTKDINQLSFTFTSDSPYHRVLRRAADASDNQTAVLRHVADLLDQLRMDTRQVTLVRLYQVQSMVLAALRRDGSIAPRRATRSPGTTLGDSADAPTQVHVEHF